MDLILASSSPRRRELMEKFHRPFRVLCSQKEERYPAELAHEEVPEYLAAQKAGNVFEELSEEEQARSVVIGSDTVVLLDGKILGKPRDEAQAKEMLRALSGRTHQVVTGVCLKTAAREERFRSVAEVSFYPLTDEEIDAYVAGGEPMDKAGAYGVQGDGALLVRKINGDFYTVMGFPIGEVVRRVARL